MLNVAIGLMSAGIWAYLIFARGRFWTCSERDTGTPPAPAVWPRVTAIVPARDEADCIAESIGSLLRQDYPGDLSVILVDDNSDDGTAAVAGRTANSENPRTRLTIVKGLPLAPGWTGKLWAMKQGMDAALASPPRPDYLLFTDADIAHAPDSVRWLASHAVEHGTVLTSLMAKLRCETLPERSHVPAFILFFQMLYPFAWVNQPRSLTAAAAGGCMLVDAKALRRAGGIEAIRGSLIDDCAMGSLMKEQGPIWLGLTNRVRSIRHYAQWEDVRRMVSRSAYAQLHYSPWLLLGTCIGMALTYLAPPLLTLFAGGWAQLLGALAWAAMALAFQPTLRFYRLSPLWGIALPAIGVAYTAYTLLSAVEYMRGRGGQWKGRTQANVQAR
jgi:hopene-associated glycosyltransferase HpnB